MIQRPAIRKRAPSDLPPWLVRGERLLIEAVRSVRLLGSVVPRNASQERARILEALEAGQSVSPRWSYARTDHTALRKALGSAAQRLATAGTPGVAAQLFGALARARFRSLSPQAAGEATILARKWIAEAHEALAGGDKRDALLASDSSEPTSLLMRMREEVSRLGLPFAVVVQPSLSALAATGERHILVASNRMTSREDVERTVMHEIEAHAIPRTRAAQAPIAIFQIGTARGVDDQEGLALVLEERGNYLSPRRKRELAARHLAVEAMDGGATFADALSALVKEHGMPAPDAVLVAERAFRGGDGVMAGLGRERIYLEAFLRVGEHLRRKPTDEGILTSGQVSLDAIAVLGPLVRKGRQTEPPTNVDA